MDAMAKIMQGGASSAFQVGVWIHGMYMRKHSEKVSNNLSNVKRLGNLKSLRPSVCRDNQVLEARILYIGINPRLTDTCI